MLARRLTERTVRLQLAAHLPVAPAYPGSKHGAERLRRCLGRMAECAASSSTYGATLARPGGAVDACPNRVNPGRERGCGWPHGGPGCVFRPIRPLVPAEAVQCFRSKSSGRSGSNRPVSGSEPAPSERTMPGGSTYKRWEGWPQAAFSPPGPATQCGKTAAKECGKRQSSDPLQV
jgi:hypothetical protein